MVLDYLVGRWGPKELEGFMDRTEEVINYIIQNPRQYIYSRQKKAYRALISKHVSLYYRIGTEEIELLVFWDNRQDPDKLSL